MIILLYCAAIAVLLVLSAFFSGSEIAYSAVNRVRLEAAAAHSKAAAVALYIADRFDWALSAILIGNNLVNLSASSIATLIALLLAGENEGRQDLFSTVAAILLTVLVLIFGESMPKIVAKKDPLGFASRVSRPLRVVMFVLFPVTWVICGLVKLLTMPLKGEKLDQEEQAEAAEEELVDLIEASEDQGIIDEDRSELLQNALDFSEISAQEVMTSRVDMLALDLDDDRDSLLRQIEDSPFSRLPVYDKRMDNIVGVLHLNQFYRAKLDNPQVDLRDLLLEPCFVYKTMKLPKVLVQLRQSKTHIALVTDDYGGVIGCLTMEDVLEQIVGEIWDDNDEAVDEVVERNRNEFEVDGDVTIGEFCELMDWNEDLFETESVTVSGWTLEMFEGFPKEGDSFTYENITVTVLEMDNLRVGKVLIVRQPAPEEEE